MALPGRWRLWWEVQWCPHGATGLGKDREKTPTYIEMWLLYPCIYDTTKTHLWEDLWCSLRGQTQSFSWGLCAPSTWVVWAVLKWLQQSTWVMFARDCSYSCCCTSGAGVAGLEHSTDPVIWLWLVSSLAGSEQLRNDNESSPSKPASVVSYI